MPSHHWQPGLSSRACARRCVRVSLRARVCARRACLRARMPAGGSPPRHCRLSAPELAVNTPFPRSTFRTSDFQCPPNRKAANHRPPNRTGRREPPPPIYPCSELRPPTSDLLLGARNGLTIGREQTDPCRSSRWRLWVLMVFPESALACVEEAQHPRPPSWLHRESHRSPFASHRIASQPGRAACPARAALCSRTEASIERAAKALKVEGVKHYTDMHALFAGVWRC